MKFSDLRVGDIFSAYGATFQKTASFTTPELADANAINSISGRPAFFGATVPVELVKHGESRDGDELCCFSSHSRPAAKTATAC